MAFDGNDMPWDNGALSTNTGRGDNPWNADAPHPSEPGEEFVSRRERFEQHFHPPSGDPSKNRSMQNIRFTIDRTLLAKPKVAVSGKQLNELKSKIEQERLSHQDEMEDPVEDEYDELLADMTAVIQDNGVLVKQVAALREYAIALEAHGFEIEEEREYLLNELDDVENDAKEAAEGFEEKLQEGQKEKRNLEFEVQRLTAELEKMRDDEATPVVESNENGIRRPVRQLPQWLRPGLRRRQNATDDDGHSHADVEDEYNISASKMVMEDAPEKTMGPEEGRRFMIPFRRRRRGLNRQNSREGQDANPQSQPPSPNASHNQIIQ